MRFKLWSDLHLEFENKILDFDPEPQQDDKYTVLILAGDIATGVDAVPFIQKMCKRFYKVAYCLGNHEFYGREYNKVRAQWANRPEMPANFILLDDHMAIIDDPFETGKQARIVGGTLWTDFSGGDYFAMSLAQSGMNDFHCIKFKSGNTVSGYRKRKFQPQDTVRAHKQTLFFITEMIREKFDGPTVIITHHLPHPLCVAPEFRTNRLNPAYVSNLNEVIENNDIAAWCFGHTHTSVNIEVHDTRLICNPRGYTPDDLNAEFDENFTFEV